MYGRPPYPRMMGPGFRGPPPGPYGFHGPPMGPRGPLLPAPGPGPGPMWYPRGPMPGMYPEPPMGPPVPWTPVPGVPYNPQKYMSAEPKPPGTAKALEKKVKVGSVSASPVGTILNQLKKDLVRCPICKVDCTDQKDYQKHLTTDLHRERVAFRTRLNKSKIEQAKAALLDKVSSGQIDLSKAKTKLSDTADNKDKAATDKDKAATDKDNDKSDTGEKSTTEAGKGGDKSGAKIPINIKYKGNFKKKEEEKPKVPKTCDICNIQLPSLEDYNKHVQTLMHENKVASKKREEREERSRGRARSQEMSRGHDRSRGRDRSRDRQRGRDRSGERSRGRERSRERHRSDYSPDRGLLRRTGRYPENPGPRADNKGFNGDHRSSVSERLSPGRRSPDRQPNPPNQMPHSQPALLPTPVSVPPNQERPSRFPDDSGYRPASGTNYRPPLLNDPEPPVNAASRAPLLANPVMQRTGPALADDKEYCTVCNISMPNHEAFVKHIGGILHREKVAASRGQKPREGPKQTASGREYARNFVGFYESLTTQQGPNAGPSVQASRYCALCDVPFQSEETYNRHLRGLMHIQKVKASGLGEAKPEPERKRKLEEQTDKLSCEICGIECFSMNTYASHMERIHNKKTLLPTPEGGGPAAAPSLEPQGRPSSLTPFLQQTHQALIGLSYIREYQHPSQDKLSTFECDLCSDTFTYNTVADHLVVSKHRLLYFERHHPDIAAELRRQPQSLEFYSHDIEARSGRGAVRVIPASSATTDPKKSRFDVNNTALIGQPTHGGQQVLSGYSTTTMTPTVAAPVRQWELPQQAAAAPSLHVETPQLSESEKLLKLTQLLGATSALTAPATSLQTETPDVNTIASNARNIEKENEVLAAILALATNKANANAAPALTTGLTTPLTTGLTTGLAALPQKTGNEEYDPFEATAPDSSSYQSTGYGAYSQHSNYAAMQGAYNQPSPASYGSYDNRAAVTGPIQPAADSQGPLANVLSTMAGCMVSNEDDAAVALQVSSTLTQALLQYKLQNTQSSTSGGIPDYASISERLRHLHNS